MKARQVVFSDGGRVTIIDPRHILYIEAEAHYARVHCRERNFVINGPFKEIEKRLDRHEFLRVHRSFIVSVDHIWEIGEREIVLDDIQKSIVPFTRTYREELMAELRRRNYLRL